MSSGRILIVDDDPKFRQVIKVNLTGEGYEVAEVRSGGEALEVLRKRHYDLMLLEMNIPGDLASETCKAVRTFSDTSIIVLAVGRSENDKVSALDAGADDFVTKPFSTPELLARIRAVLRRAPLKGLPPRVMLDGVEIDFQTRTVHARGEELHLTPKEFGLLRYFMMNPNRVIPHRELLRAAWGADDGDNYKVESLHVFIGQLRRKIEGGPDQAFDLVTEPQIGYRFVLRAASAASLRSPRNRL